MLASFKYHSAKWHKSCRNKYSIREFDRKSAAVTKHTDDILSTLSVHEDDGFDTGDESAMMPIKRRCTRTDLNSSHNDLSPALLCSFVICH